MPAVGRLSGTPASISASDDPHTVAMDDEPFELGDLRDDADGVREFGRGRQHRANGAPGELAVPDFAPAGRSHAAGFADRIGGKVVVEQEPLLIGPVQRIDILLVLARAQRGDDHRLRFSTREQSGAMGSGQHPDLGQDRAHGGQIPPVDAALVVENVPAHDLGLSLVERLRDLLRGKLRFLARGRERAKHLRLGGVDGGVTLLLLCDRIGGAQIGLARIQHRLLDRSVIVGREVAGLLGGLLGQTDNRLDDRLECGVTGHHRFQHRVFAELLGLRLDHQHGVRGAGDDQIERRILHFLDRRVDPHFTLDDADAGRSDRAHERDAREGERGRGGDHRQNVRIRLEIIREDRGDDLRVATEVIGEQRSDRPVDQAGGQRFPVGQAPFALEIAAGNSSRGEGLFLVVDGEGKEILAGLRLLGGDDGRQHRGLAPGGEHRPVRLAGHTAGFERELAPAPVEFFTLYVKHLSSSCVS